jgi:hypothetical protein
MNIIDLSSGSEDLRDYLNQRNQLYILYTQSFVNNIFPVLAALWLTFILRDASNRLHLYSWFGVILFFSVIRHFLLIIYRRTHITPDNIGFWLNTIIITVFISGVIWAAAGILLIPYHPHEPIEFTLYNGLVLLTICGLVAGAVISYSVNIFVLISYSYTALLPPAFFLITLGDRHNSAFGGLVLLYCFFISVAAFRMNRQFRYFMDMEFEKEAIRYRYERLKGLYEDLKQRNRK